MILDRTQEIELVKAVLAGDDDACSDLYRQYLNFVRRALSMVPEQDREDETQVAFVRIFKNLHMFRGDSALSTWIHRLSVNCGLMYLRKKRQDSRYLTISIDDTFDGEQGEIRLMFEPSQEDPGHQDLHARNLTERVLNGAKEADRFILEKLLEGYGPVELSSMIGQSLSATKSRVYHVRQRAKERIGTLVG